MAHDDPKNDSSSHAADSETAQHLDLSSPVGFTQATEWVCNAVLLSQPAAPMLELDLRVAAQTKTSEERRATIFMDSKDGYVVGFRGKDAVYLLSDPERDIEAKLREAKLIGKDEKPVTLKVRTDHKSLGTFEQVWSGSGFEGRTFGIADLYNSGKLSGFSVNQGEVTYDDVRNSLSLLTCMTVESARSRTVELGFQRIYNHDRVRPDTVMQSYDQAKRITAYAELFPNHVLADRVEKLENRARELGDLVKSVQRDLGLSKDRFRRQDFLDQAIKGTVSKGPESVARAGARVREIAIELDIKDGSKLGEIMSLCSNKDAVRAAKGGVLPPPKRLRSARG
jgi:hypothetical protein